MHRVSRGAAVIGLTVGAAALLGTILGRLDPGAVDRALAEARWGWLAALLGAFAANHLLRIVRWQVVLGAGVPWRRTAAVCLVAFLGIMVLPLRLGELLRPALHARDGVPVGRSVAALLVERLLDLVALLGLLGWAAAVPEVPPLEVDGVDVTALARRAALGGIVALAGVLAAAAVVGERIEGWRVVGPTAAALARAARELLADPGRAALAVALTAATWATPVLYAWCGLQVLPSLPGSLEAAAFGWAGVMAATTALPTPGFFGSYEAGAGAALSLYGADPDLAVVYALGLHVAYLGFVAVLGIPFAVAELDTVLAALRRRT